MPIREYYCGDCDNKIERIEFIRSMWPPPECATCGRTMEKIPSVSAFALAGKGWAKDGYSSSKPD